MTSSCSPFSLFESVAMAIFFLIFFFVKPFVFFLSNFAPPESEIVNYVDVLFVHTAYQVQRMTFSKLSLCVLICISLTLLTFSAKGTAVEKRGKKIRI